MMNNIIQYSYTQKQASTDGGSLMDRESRNSFIEEIVQTYKEDMDDGYYVNVADLTTKEKQIFLSHLVSAEEYEEIILSHSTFEAYYLEYKKMMQKLIDQYAETMYSEDMYERGLICRKHADNGEAYWVRRC